jgi:hypothetical protein
MIEIVCFSVFSHLFRMTLAVVSACLAARWSCRVGSAAMAEARRTRMLLLVLAGGVGLVCVGFTAVLIFLRRYHISFHARA